MKFWFGWMLMGSLAVFAVTGCQDDRDRDRTSPPTSPPPAAWDLSGNWQVREAFCEETAAGVNLSAEEFDATLLEFEQGMDDYLWVRNVHGNFSSQQGSVSGDRVSFAFGPVQWNPKANLVVAGVSFNGSVVREGRIEGNFEVSFSSGERATCGADLDRLEEPAVDHSGDWVLVEGSDVTCTLDLGGWGDPEAEAVRLKDRLEAASTGASSVWQLGQDPEGNAIRGLKYGSGDGCAAGLAYDSGGGCLTGYVEGNGIYFYPVSQAAGLAGDGNQPADLSVDAEDCWTTVTGTYDDAGEIGFSEVRTCLTGDILWDLTCSYTVEAK